jgi:hypothetical protein
VSIITKTARPGETRTQSIRNVYNPIKQARGNRDGTLPDLGAAVWENQEDKHLALGVLNLAHPLWAAYSTGLTSNETKDLLEQIRDNRLDLLLLLGVKTKEERGEPSTIDLIFGNRLLSESIIHCGLACDELDHDSEHLSSTTVLNLGTAQRSARKKRLRHNLRQKYFVQGLKWNLGSIKQIRSQEIDEQVQHLVGTFQTAMNTRYSESKACPRSVPGWTPEIKRGGDASA